MCKIKYLTCVILISLLLLKVVEPTKSSNSMNGVTPKNSLLPQESLREVASVASSILFKSLTSLTESNTEQTLTNFDLGRSVVAEMAAVDEGEQMSTEAKGSKAVSSDLSCISNRTDSLTCFFF